MTKKIPSTIFNAVFDPKFEAPAVGSTLLMCKGGPKRWMEQVDIVNLQTGEVLFSMSPAEGGRKRVFTNATAKVWSWSFCEYAVNSTKHIGCFVHDGDERLVMFVSKDGTSTIDGTLPVKTADGSDFSISVARVDGLQRSCSRMRTDGTGTEAHAETAQEKLEKMTRSQLQKQCEQFGVDKASIEKADEQDSKDAYVSLLMAAIQAKMKEGKDMVICKEYSNQKMWMSELKATQEKRGIQDKSKDNMIEASTAGFQFFEVRPGVNLALAVAVIIPARQCFEWYYSQFFDPSNAVPDKQVDPVNSTLIVPETHKP